MPEIGRVAEVVCASLPDREHFWTELDSGELDVPRIEGEVSGGAAGELEHLAARLGADPLPSAGEQDPLKEADLAVVPGCMLVLHTTDAFGLGNGVHRTTAN
jgi:hypothetical protein